ncbi:hypothetical protein TIFTF001_033233 [Ficus carica]|uniref:Uncharacterized protein n=1 Tax=Ficus carica TaxID=3494 RepID=A0AA88DY04_FICCA|nr:hypothetical protein TIFTF001_033233 [Ficus carica]
MNLKNQHLKDFVFTSSDWRDSLEITIDTPDLVSFSYIGFSLFKISVHAPNLLDASIKFKVLDRHWKAYSDYCSSKAYEGSDRLPTVQEGDTPKIPALDGTFS